MTIQAVVIPAYSWYDNGTIENPSILYGDPIFTDTDSFFLGGGYFTFIFTTDEHDAPYGYKYEFTTSPNAQISIYAMDYDDAEAFYNSGGLTNRGKTLEDKKTSGKGSFRFTSNDYWFLFFENLDEDTTISYTISLEKIAPIGLIIGLSVGGVVIAAIIVGVVISVNKKKKRASGYIPPSASTYSGYSSASPYGAAQTPITPAYATPIAAPTDNVQDLFNSANSEFQQGNVIQAMNLWEQILVSSPDFYPAMCNLAVAHMSLGNTPRAVEYLNQALGIKPDYKPALDLLEIAKSKQGEVPPG
ncbi:MAG: tetratricopeptide repeat protein [Candidatus Heimdallarchaeota archaeon]